jgi:hypothetical protein
VSSSALAVKTPIEVVQRPDAPYDLTDEESQEWWAIVNDLPADWFPRHTHSLLGQYCRHVVNSRRIARLIEQALSPPSDDEPAKIDLGEYDKLLAMQEREGRAMSSLATRMRLTQQATVRAESAKKPKQVKRPWD